MKTKFNFVDPKVIMSVVVVLMIFAVGVFVVFTTVTAITPIQEKNTRTYQDFLVTDPSVDQTCDIGTGSASGMIVEKWDGSSWIVISSTYWSYSGDVVTVAKEGL